MSTRLLLPRSQAIGRDGRPIVGAKLYTYVSGTSTAKPVWTDPALSVAHSNPVEADDRGAFPAMFMEAGDYKTVLTDAADDVIWTDDPVSGDAGGGTAASVPAMRNRIVNGAMQYSQEVGTVGVNCTDGAVYVLDQWIGSLSSTPGGTMRVVQEAFQTPAGNTYRLRATVPTADASLTSDAFYVIETPIMGAEVASMRWGASARKQLILRFGVWVSVAGTYCVSVTNSALNRSWVGTFTVDSSEINSNLVRTLVIPGDNSGTWLTDNGVGLRVRWCIGCGTDYQGVEGWQAGNIMATSSQLNVMATINAYFRLFDVGLYIDPDQIGVPPAYEQPDPTLELMRCLPFWRRLKTALQFPAGGAEAVSGGYVFIPPMRAVPTVTMTSDVAARSNVDAAYPVVSDIDPLGLSASIVSAGAGDSYDRGRIWIVDARL